MGSPQGHKEQYFTKWSREVKTLAPEIAHAILHEVYKDRRLAGLEADPHRLRGRASPRGLDTSDYSFGYVANWASGGDEVIASIKGTAIASRRPLTQSCDRSRRTSKRW